MSDSMIVAGGQVVSGPALRPQVFHSPEIQSGISVDPGDPVTLFDEVRFSKADNVNTANVAGLCCNAAEEGGGVSIQYGGPMTLPTARWDAITGGSGGLTPHSIYYLSAATAGKLTTTKPVGGSNFVTPVGFAISTTTLMIQIGAAVQNGS